MARILQGTFLVDTTTGFQQIFNLVEPLRSASIFNTSTVSINIALGSNDVRFWSLPATTAIDLQPWDLDGLRVGDEPIVIMKMTFTAANTAPVGTAFTLLALLAKKRLAPAFSQTGAQ